MVLAKQKLRAKTKNLCEIETCNREAKVCGLCNPCYSAELYWSKKTVSERRKRLAQISIFFDRMERFSVAHLRSVK